MEEVTGCPPWPLFFHTFTCMLTFMQTYIHVINKYFLEGGGGREIAGQLRVCTAL